MSAQELFVALAGMTREQRESRAVVVRVQNGERPAPYYSVNRTTVHHSLFECHIDQ